MIEFQHHGFFSRHARVIAIGILALLACGASFGAWAANASCTGGSLALTLPSVTVTHDTTVGTLLGSPTTGTATFTCENVPSTAPTKEAGIQVYNLEASQLSPATLPSTTSTDITTLTFATNVTGIALQLTMSPAMRGYDQSPGDQQANAYIAGYATGTAGTLAINYSAQLIVTGAVTPGTINALTLLNYEWYIYGCSGSTCGNASTSASLGTHLTIVGGSTAVTLQGCTVNTDSTSLVVTLPTVSTTAMTGVSSTAGSTPFAINLTCQLGTTVLITMAASNPNTTYTGVMKSTTGTGYATNVGVQLLYAGTNVNGYLTPTPVTFNTAQNLGASPSGTMAVQYDARYYQTGATVTAGKVAATATFTMSYQ